MRSVGIATLPLPALAPAAWMLLLLSGGAWSWLLHSQWFAAFDPQSMDNLCMSWVSGSMLSPGRLWQAAAQFFVDGMLMVAAMMLPGALRSSLSAAGCSAGCGAGSGLLRQPQDWRGHAWIGGYLLVWGGVLLLLACLMTLLATRGMPTDAALQALAKTAPAGLALLAGALQWAQAFSGNPQRLRAHATPRAGVQPPWRAGVAAGMQCVARCALPMLALHAIYGMSLVMMACYTGLLWWRAGTDSPWPGVVGGLALMGSAASTLPFSFT
jgi:Predicted metal-binding integral membrane protein (DUF2182)